MLSYETLALLLLVGLVYAFWSQHLRARELAVQHCAKACQSANIQFLDQSVSMLGLRLQRDGNGRIGLVRRFGFDFSVDGVARHHGVVMVAQNQVISLVMDMPQGMTISDSEHSGQDHGN